MLTVETSVERKLPSLFWHGMAGVGSSAPGPLKYCSQADAGRAGAHPESDCSLLPSARYNSSARVTHPGVANSALLYQRWATGD